MIPQQGDVLGVGDAVADLRNPFLGHQGRSALVVLAWAAAPRAVPGTLKALNTLTSTVRRSVNQCTVYDFSAPVPH